MERWRYIDSGSNDGFTNMATDAALAQCYQGTPLLRLYAWSPPAISLGFHQRLNDLDRAKCQQDGIDVVFRPTGGRAVLHADEVTYAVILGPESRLYDSRVLPVYERISQGIMAALADLNIAVDFERAARSAAKPEKKELSRLCFASSIQYEIGHAGRKMIGSAQRRFGTVVLQHGSILLGKRHLDLADYLARRDADGPAQIRRFMEEKTISLNEIAPVALAYDQLSAALRAGFARHWGIEFSDSTLDSAEEGSAARLREAYLHKSSRDGQRA